MPDATQQSIPPELQSDPSYWRGKYEACEEARKEMAELARTFSHFEVQKESMRGMIGSGSQVNYGSDTAITDVAGLIGLGVTVAGCVLTVGGFAVISNVFGVVSLALAAAGATVAVVSFYLGRRKGASSSPLVDMIRGQR